MDDWEPRLADIDRRLGEWNARFLSELERVRKERGLDGWFKRPRPEDLRAAAAEARRRAGVEILSELEGALDLLCDHYARSLPQERAKIRARIGMGEAVFDLFWGYVEEGPERIRGPQDGPQLQRAFLAIAIDDMRAELRLIDGVMGRLVIAAVAAGLDWRTPLALAARVANPGAGGGGACMREYFEGFERSEAFRKRVASEIAGPARGAAGHDPKDSSARRTLPIDSKPGCP